MPTEPIKLDQSTFELNVRFRVDKIREFFDVPFDSDGPQRRSTETFGQGWSFIIIWSRLSEADCALGVFLKPPGDGFPHKVAYSIRAESLTGRQYFASYASFLFPPGDPGRGKRRSLTLADHWQQDGQLRAENAFVIVATVKTILGPHINAQSVLNFIHRTITDSYPSGTSFIAFRLRTSSGGLGRPRTFFADRDVMESASEYLDNYFQDKKDTTLMYQLAEDSPMVTANTDYTDTDSDFSGEEEEDVPEGTVKTPADQDPGEGDIDIDCPLSPESESMQVDVLDPASSMAMTVKTNPITIDQIVDLRPSRKTSSIESQPAVLDDKASSFDTHVVTGAAAITWESFLFYLYTGNVVFAPLTSEGEAHRESFIYSYQLRNPEQPAPCSCKSMYRLADKMGLEVLKDRALDHLKSRLSVEIILSEVFSIFTSQHEEVQKIEFAILMQHWSKLNSTSALSDRLDGIAIGNYPHARWMLGELVKTLTPRTIQPA